MPSTISAGTSAGTALNLTSDTTGNLAFQTNNGVTALTIDTSQNVTFANNVTYTGNITGSTITATAAFSGNGATISAINASNVTSGTLASARLPTSGVNASSITAGTLAVAQGGTGTSTPSLVGGTNITISGTWPNQTVTAAGGAAQLQEALYLSGTSTWTAPTGVTRVRVIVIGGGGAGGAGANNGPDGAPGGQGGLAIGSYTVTPGTGYTVTVGGGGARSSGSGGTSSFGAFLSATGGGGGQGGGGSPGGSGNGSGGTIRNSNVGIGNATPFEGQGTQWNIATQSFSIGSIYGAGQNGNGGPVFCGSGQPGGGGIGGVVYLQWVGS